MDTKYVPPIVAAVIVFVGVLIFYGNAAMMGNFILLGALIGIIPYVITSYLDYQRIRVMEDQIPVFVLDLAETQKAGMSLAEGLRQISKTDYGKLSPEIKKMNDQISWGIPLQDVMDRFAKRNKESKMIGRVVRIINEAFSSGGDIARTMEATSSDILDIRETEKERASMIRQHVLVIYAIYYIFIGIVIGISKTLIPMLQLNIKATPFGGALGFQDPCTVCYTNPNLYCVSCSVFNLVSSMFGLGAGALGYYNSLFLMMIVIQGIFSGLVAGQIGENSMRAGLKHSVIMSASGFAVLLILFRSGLV
jgi:flagellar protein FlaJ